MKTKLNSFDVRELTDFELRRVTGGGGAAEPVYYATYFALRANPLFWVLKADVAIINAIAN